MSSSATHAQLHALNQYATSPTTTNASALSNPVFNKGTAFSAEEREQFRLRGLLPHRIETLEQQATRAMKQLRSQETPLLRNVFLEALRCRNETLFFRLMVNHFEELAPLVYTPIVGQACQQFSLQLREHSGLFITKYDRGQIAHVLDSWRRPNVDIIVVTDGSRILGLGDLGAGGMGIPVGKLILYTAAAGFHPSATLPITLDVGCNSDVVLADPHYVGVPEKRTLSEAEYYAFVDEFMEAVYRKWPNVLVQFEDFSNDHCFDLLARYRDKYLMFNDDIQGTGAVVAAGIVNAWRATGTAPASSKFVFLGAGAAGVGVAQQIVDILVLEHGVDRAAAYKQFYFVDSRGVVAKARGDKLEAHKLVFARDDLTAEQVASLKTLEQVVEFVKPDTLVGLSGMAKAFTPSILRTMGKNHRRPVIFSLSNPTDKSECTAREAYEATEGRAIFAAGSPFEPVTLADGVVCTPGQANNMYVFPSIGFAASLCAAKRVTDHMVAASVIALAAAVSDEEIRAGLIYPKLRDIRRVANVVTKAVIQRCVADGEARRAPPTDFALDKFIQDAAYNPDYAVVQQDAKL